MRFVFLFTLLLNSVAFADIEWTGTYRFEGVKVENADINTLEENTQYILHHLVLNPKITAYDGLTIQGRFDILNSNSYPNSGMGQFFGNGVGATPAVPSANPGGNAGNSGVLSENQRAEMIDVNQLYLTYAHEFGVLTVGRAPLHFGLGMSYNNGSGAFDHWFDNRDLVAYKFVTGNLTFMPVIAKVVEGELDIEDDIDDYMVHVQYENPESELKLGLMYRRRHAAKYGNDIPPATFGGTMPTASGFKGEYWNLFFSRWIGSSFKIGLEAATQSGQTGVTATAGGSVELDGFGAALELDWIPKAGSFHTGLKAGIASGDDATTPNSYEGFIFDRNYDVAFLLFNHPMGQYDVFRTAAIRDPTLKASTRADEEAISNVLYVSPYFKYRWTEKFDTQLGLTYASLNSDPLSTASVDKAVGFEVDITLNYRPYDNVQWVNRVGVFAPGSAFEGGGLYQTDTVYGLETKAAISF